MVRCFMTGLELPIDQALVLNRRAAIDLLFELKDRVATLRRIVTQYSPMDDFEHEDFGRSAPADSERPQVKKHRLICPAAARVLAPSFPEIALFVTWPEYKARVRAPGGATVVDGGASEPSK